MSKAKQAARAASKQSEGILAQQASSVFNSKHINHSVQSNAISFRYRDADFVILIFKAINVSKAHRDEVMDLLEENMREMYIASSMGWKLREKQGELFDKEGRFLLVRDDQNQLVAFVNWRFDCEDCDESEQLGEEEIIEVLYCYEVQVKSKYRSQKWGQLLMDLLYSIARQSHMRKIMLTVFLSNEGARRFYLKLGYSSDAISPILYEEEEDASSSADYDIMSKGILA